MIKIYYQFSKEHSSIKRLKEVYDFEELEEFIFKTATAGRTDDKKYMDIPTSKDYIHSINFWTGYDKGQCYIHKIENDKGIIFSDGTYTSNQKFISDGFLKFCNDCNYKAINKIPPTYNFVNDSETKNKYDQAIKTLKELSPYELYDVVNKNRGYLLANKMLFTVDMLESISRVGNEAKYNELLNNQDKYNETFDKLFDECVLNEECWTSHDNYLDDSISNYLNLKHTEEKMDEMEM